MSSRRFRKRIEIWQTKEPTSDGFGGFTASDELITTTWADLKSFSGNKPYSKESSDFGITNSQLAIIVTVRKRNDFYYNSINQFIKYNGEKYTILSFPEDKNFDHAFITFIAVKEDTKAVSTVTPIDSVSIYANYEERVSLNGGFDLYDGCQKNFIQATLEG